MFVVGCALEGIWKALQSIYGPNPYKGWREWHRTCDRLDKMWADALEEERRQNERRDSSTKRDAELDRHFRDVW